MVSLHGYSFTQIHRNETEAVIVERIPAVTGLILLIGIRLSRETMEFSTVDVSPW